EQLEGGVGRLEPRQRAFEQADAERRLQRLDVAAQSRLAEAKGAPRRRQRAVLDHGGEAAPQRPVGFGGGHGVRPAAPVGAGCHRTSSRQQYNSVWLIFIRMEFQYVPVWIILPPSARRKHMTRGKVTILGSNGHIGHHAARAFVAAGWDVTGFGRVDRAPVAGMRFVAGDADSLADLSAAIGDSDVVVNALNLPYDKWDNGQIGRAHV